MREWYQSFLRRGIWLAALAGVFVLQVWFPNLQNERHDSYSVEYGGRKALFNLAEVRAATGKFPPVQRNLDPISRATALLSSHSLLCLLGPSRQPNRAEWSALLNWVDQGGSLLVAASWHEPAVEIGELKLGVARPSEVAKKLKAFASGSTAGPPSKIPHSPSASVKAMNLEKDEDLPGTFTNDFLPEAQVEWRTRGEIFDTSQAGKVLAKLGPHPQVSAFGYGEGRIVVIASDYLFSNDALAMPGQEHAALALKILEYAAADSQQVVFDEYLNNTGTPQVVGLLLNHALRPITIQLFAILLLFACTGAQRFGGLIPPVSTPRQDFTEHVNALGALYYRVNNGTAMLQTMFDQLRFELHLHGDQFPPGRAGEALAARLRRSPQELTVLWSDVHAALKVAKLPRRQSARLIRAIIQVRASLVRREAYSGTKSSDEEYAPASAN